MVDFNRSFLTIGSNIQGLSSDNPEEKVAAIQDTMKCVTEILGAALNGTAALEEARTDESDGEQKIKEYSDEADRIKGNTKEKFNQYVQKFNEQAQVIEQALSQLDRYQQEIQEYNARLEEQKAIVEEQQAIINDPSSKRKEKKEALEKISSAFKEINDLSADVAEYSEICDELSQQVETSTAENDDIMAQADSTISKGNADVEKVIADQTAQVAHEGDVVKKGVANEKKGAELAAKASGEGIGAIFSFGATASSAAMDATEATQYITAGGMQIASGTANGVTLGKGIKMAGSLLTTFSGYMGSMNTQHSEVFGYINTLGSSLTSFSPVIESWGSFGSYAQEGFALAEEMITELEEGEDEESEGNEGEQSNDSSIETFDVNKFKLEQNIA